MSNIVTKIFFISFLFLCAVAQSNDDVLKKIRTLQYKGDAQFLSFFKKKYYKKYNKRLSSLRKKYEDIKLKIKVEDSSKKKKSLKKKLNSVKKKFQIAARIVRFYEHSQKKYEASIAGDKKNIIKYKQLAYLARLEYEEFSGKKFASILKEYRNLAKKK